MSNSTFTQTIALQGGDDVKKQLAAIGQTGQQAFAQASQGAQQASGALGSLGAALSGLFSGFGQIVQQVATVGSSLGQTFDPLISSAGSALSAMTKAGAGFGVIAGAAAGVSGAIGKIGQDAANSVAKLNDAAEAAGLTLEQFRALKAGAEGVGVSGDELSHFFDGLEKVSRQAELTGKTVGRWLHNGDDGNGLSGGTTDRRGGAKWIHPPASSHGEDDSGALKSEVGTTEELSGAQDKAAESSRALGEGLRGFNRELSNGVGVIRPASEALGEHKNKLQRSIEAFKAFGVSLTDAYGHMRPQKELYDDTVAALSRLPDNARRTDLAVRAFGEGLGHSVLKLADSRAELEATAKAVEKSGVAFSDAQKANAQAARESGSALSAVIESWRQYFAALATPVALDQNNSILGFLERNQQTIKDFADNVVGPAVRWLGQFQNALGASAIAAGVLGGALGLVGTAAAASLGAAGAAVIFFWDGIKSGAATAFAFVRDQVGAAASALKGFFASHDFTSWEGIKQAAADAFAFLRNQAQAAGAAINRALSNLGFGGVWDGVKSAAASAWEAIKSGALAAQAEIARVFAENDLTTFEGWKNAAAALFNDLASVAQNAWGRIEQAFANGDLDAVWTSFAARAQEAFSRLGELASQGYQAVKAAALSAFPALAEPWANIEQLAKSLFETIRGLSKETWIEIGVGALAGLLLWGDGFSALALAAAVGWRAVMQGAIELSPVLRTAFTAFRATATEAFGSIAQVGRAAWTYIAALLSGDTAAQASAWNVLRAATAETWGEITSLFARGYAFIRDQITSAIPVLRAPWLALEQAVSDAWAAIKTEHQAGWPTIKGIWDNLVATWKGVKAAADTVAGAINLIFGTKYSGTQLLLIGVFLQLIGLGPLVIESIALVVVGIELFGAALAAIPALATAVGAAIEGISLAGSALVAAFALFAANPWALLIVAAIAAIGVALYELYTHWDQIKAAASATWEAIKSGAAGAWAAIKAGAEAFFSWLDAKWNALKDLGGSLWDKFKDGATSAWDAVKTAFTDSVTWIESKWNGLIAKIKSGLAAIGLGSSSSASDSSSAAANDNSGPSDPSAAGFASGGLLSGPGTATSDSILARLSNGEFVVNARAVAHWGADLFHALNGLQMPQFAHGGFVGDLIVPRFAFGGVVGAPTMSLPKFADGGLASRAAERHGLISFPLDLGGKQHEVYADRDTVTQMKRHSALAQIASTTKRSPGWNR